MELQTALYKGRAKGPFPAQPGNGNSPSAVRDQRPALSAIYPRGSVCAVVLGGGEADSRCGAPDARVARPKQAARTLHTATRTSLGLPLSCAHDERRRRLFPLTEKRTLPAIPVGASYRLIDVPISCLINSGIRKIFVLTQYNSTSLNKYLQVCARGLVWEVRRVAHTCIAAHHLALPQPSTAHQPLLCCWWWCWRRGPRSSGGQVSESLRPQAARRVVRSQGVCTSRGT